MEGYDGCHCNPGFMQDSNDTYFGKDVCIADPTYSTLNLSFEQGSLEHDIILALEGFNEAGGIISEGSALQAIDSYIYQMLPSSWTLPGVDNMTYKSKDYYNSNLTLVEFFHTDCSVCNAQIPDLKEFYANHSDQVDVISIGGYSLGGNVDDLSSIEDFASEHNVSWPYVLDEDGTMMTKFGLESRYPSWVLLEGNLSSGLPQVVDTFVGRESYDDLVHRIENRSSPTNISEQLVEIIDYFGHWNQNHISDREMLSIISDLLGYEFESDVADEVANYGVSHSNKLYIIDSEGNIRVVWRGIEWTYASVYHDIQLLML